MLSAYPRSRSLFGLFCAAADQNRDQGTKKRTPSRLRTTMFPSPRPERVFLRKNAARQRRMPVAGRRYITPAMRTDVLMSRVRLRAKPEVQYSSGRKSGSAQRRTASAFERCSKISTALRKDCSCPPSNSRKGRSRSWMSPARAKALWLNIGSLSDEDVEELMESLCSYEGDTPVYFVRGRTKMVCSQKVNPGKALMAELASFLSRENIKLI